ncbi:kinesin-like nuclear fusion protein [Pestalotiopsis sp. IQ-011]
MQSLLEAEHRKWTHTDEAEIETNWFQFEKALLRNQRWSFGRLNVATLQTFQDMYCHLQFRVRIAESACGEAALAILALQEQLDERTRELDMHDDLGERLGQFTNFVEEGNGQANGEVSHARSVRAGSRAAGMTQEAMDETAALRAQLESAELQKEGLESALQATRFQVRELELSAGESARVAGQAGDDRLQDLQWRLQETEAELNRSIEQFKTLRVESQSAEAERQKEVGALQSKINAQKEEMRNIDGRLEAQKKESTALALMEAERQETVILDLQSRISTQENETAVQASKVGDRNRRIADLETKLRAKEQAGIATTERAAELEELLRAAAEKYTRAQDNVRQLFDQVQDFRGNLRVMCRVRPQLEARDDELLDMSVSRGAGSDHPRVLRMPKRTARAPADVDQFQMERVFDRGDANAHIFDEVGQPVMSAVNGRNVCIFAYGQTGSGKTHTMNFPWNERNAPADGGGEDVDYGIIPRSVAMISEFMRENEGIWRLAVSGRYVEIYAEKAYDLLRESGSPQKEVNVRFAKVGGADVYEAESAEVDLTGDGECDFEDRVRDLLFRASANRRTRTTAGNAQSSRSHSVLTLRITAERVDGKSDAVTEGLLNLIDLAGSEKPSTTDKTSQAEGIQINKSLSALRKVLGDMANPRVKHISFRESILTKLLQSSLGDGCKTMMFVMVSPLKKDKEETRNTLEFAMTAQQAKLKAQAPTAGKT